MKTIRALLPLALCVAMPAGARDAGPTPGEVADPVLCRADASNTYALYLPSRYRPEQRWPILYAFDARRRGRKAVDLFRDVAERRGWIVAGSNNTESDAPIAPSLQAIRAVWDDTHARLSIDDRRVYAAGFSGGARLAAGLASVRKGAVEGVIGCSGGFPSSMRPAKDTPFAFFGTAGDRDFNYQEMRALDSTLDSLGVPHRLALFEGGHSWPPVSICHRAVEWMDLQAMKRGILGPDPLLIDAALSEGLARARKGESDARFAEALTEYEDLAEDLRGLRDVSEIERDAKRLRVSTSAERELKARRKIDAEETAYQLRMGRALSKLRNPEEPVRLAPMVEELEIPGLKRRVSQKGDSYEGLSAGRRLESTFSSTAFYIFREFLEAKNYARAALSLLIALEIKPEDPSVWYNLACADARKGQPREALDALGKAVAFGFKDVSQLEADEDLAVLRDQAPFRQLVAKLRTEGGPSPRPVP